MGVPGVKEVAHDQDDVAPTLDVLLAALGRQFEQGVPQPGGILLLVQVVSSQSGGLNQQRLKLKLVLSDAVEIPIPNGEAGLYLKRKYFKGGAKDARFGTEQLI